MTYETLEARLAAWAQTQPNIRAVIVCGSRARGDQWTDPPIAAHPYPSCEAQT